MGLYTTLGLLLFLACSTYEFQGVSSEGMKEGESITLTYPSTITPTLRKSWYKGTYNNDVPPPGANTELFVQLYPGADATKKTAPPQMTVPDITTFNLVITGVQLKDAGNFSTKTENNTGTVFYEVVQLLEVYIQPEKPEITSNASHLHNLTENDVLKVTCFVPRLYPEVEEASFEMIWGNDQKTDTVCPGDSKSNCVFSKTPITGDLAKEYKLEWTKTLNSSDDGASIKCKIIPVPGVPVMSNTLNLQVQYGPQTNPITAVDNKTPHRYDNVTFTCDYKHIDAKPKDLSMIWMFGNIEVGSRDKPLVLTSVKDEEDSGTYSCVVSNTVANRMSTKTIKVQDTYGPRNSPTLRIVPQSTNQFEDVNFDCDIGNVDANPIVGLVKWFKGIEELKPTDLNLTMQVMYGDRGDYRCEVGNNIGDDMYSAFFHLDVSKEYRPQGTLESTLSSQVPHRFDRVDFACNDSNMEADPPIHTLQWSLNGDIINAWDNQRFMTIDGVNEEHNGTYLCKVTNEVGSSESAPVVLNINPQYSPQETPTLQIDCPDTGKFENRTFECLIGNVHANPEVTLVTWTRNGEPLVDWTNYEFTVKIMVNLNDTGHYSCSLGNTIGYSCFADTMYLNVSDQYRPQGAPSIDINNTNPYSFEKVTLTCNGSEVLAKPAVSSVVWMVNGTENGWTDFVHTINDVQVSHSGDYSCRAVNTVGSSVVAAVIQLDVSPLYVPRGKVKMLVTGSVHKNHAKLKNKVVFTCNIDDMQANPTLLNITWMKGNTMLDWSPTEIEYSTIASVSDNGTYTCIVNNTIGVLSSDGVNFTTSENYAPTTTPALESKSGTVQAGVEFVFNCTIDDKEAYPTPYVDWYKNSKQIDWIEKIVKRVVTEEDSGNYTCRAKNFVDVSPFSAPVILQVEGKPGKPEEPSPVAIILGVIIPVVLIAIIIIAVIVVKKKRTSKPENRNPRSNEADMRNNPSDNFGFDNQGAEYDEIGLGAVGRAKPKPTPRKTLNQTPDLLPENTYENQRADLPDYAEVNKPPRGGAASADNNDIPTYAEVNKPQNDMAEYAEVKKPPISKKPVSPPPGTDGMMYVELDLKRDPGKKGPAKPPKPPQKPTPAPKKHVEEPTEYAQIDYTKSAKSKGADF